MDLTHTTRVRRRRMARTPSQNVPTWHDAPLAALVDHIVDKHHAYARLALSEIPPLFDGVLCRHAYRHPHLRELAVIYEGLSAELTAYMRQQERVVFPHARTTRALPSPHHIALMRHAHDTALALLRRMRELTGGYRAPTDAVDVQELYAGLEALERDLREHILLESEVLLPRLITG